MTVLDPLVAAQHWQQVASATRPRVSGKWYDVVPFKNPWRSLRALREKQTNSAIMHKKIE
jgi:hypothetical protein